jgi:hypothetical protein
MRDVSAGEGIKQSTGDMLLAYYFGQSLGTPFAIEDLSHDCPLLYSIEPFFQRGSVLMEKNLENLV